MKGFMFRTLFMVSIVFMFGILGLIVGIVVLILESIIKRNVGIHEGRYGYGAGNDRKRGMNS